MTIDASKGVEVQLGGGQPLSFASAALRYFGKRPGQTMLDFAVELKALTPDDRLELSRGLAATLNCPVGL